MQRRFASAATSLSLLATTIALGGGAVGATSADALTTASTASCLATSKAAAAQAQKPVALVAPKTSINLTPIKGKTVWIIETTENQLFTSIGSGASAAAKAAGLKVVLFNGQGETSVANTGVADAVAQHAGGIILGGVDERLVSGSVAAAKAAHIPIVDIFNGSPSDPGYPGVVGHATPDFIKDGKTMAYAMLAATGCKLDTVVWYSSLYKIHIEMANNIKSTVAQLCPSCKVKLENVDIPTLATSLPSQVETALRSDPNVNYLAPVFDSVVPYVEQGETAEGKSLPIISHDGVDANLNQIRAGSGLQKIDLAFPPNPWIGWLLIDDVARGMLGQKNVDYTVPSQFVDKANAGTSNAGLFPNYKTYAGAFEKEWKG